MKDKLEHLGDFWYTSVKTARLHNYPWLTNLTFYRYVQTSSLDLFLQSLSIILFAGMIDITFNTSAFKVCPKACRNCEEKSSVCGKICINLLQLSISSHYVKSFWKPEISHWLISSFQKPRMRVVSNVIEPSRIQIEGWCATIFSVSFLKFHIRNIQTSLVRLVSACRWKGDVPFWQMPAKPAGSWGCSTTRRKSAMIK